VAKIDRFNSRATALAEDGPLDEFYRPAGATSRPRSNRAENPLPVGAPDLRDEDDRDQEPFLRSRRRVAVRQSILPRTRIGRVALACGVALGLVVLVLLAIAIRDFLDHDPRFRIDSASNVQILGNSEVTRPELLSVFGSDIGRNIFFIPLTTRRAGLEHLAWVEHATIMRILPNQLRIAIVERVPIAFVRVGNQIDLLDHDGVVLQMPSATMAAHHYSFPVVSGISPGDPLSTREPRMHLYQKFLADLDSSGERLSEEPSEVDISDPEDIKAVVPAQGSDLLLHFGDQDFLSKFHSYQAHRDEWRQQYPHLGSVDLRDDPQVVLGMQRGYADSAMAPVSVSIPPATTQPDSTAPDSSPSVSATTRSDPPRPEPKAAAPQKPVAKPAVKATAHIRAAALHAAKLRKLHARAAARSAHHPQHAAHTVTQAQR
jgi:cell division protein FtsQ